MELVKFNAPALPLPGPNYSKENFEQLIRALTLYFNQLPFKRVAFGFTGACHMEL